MRRVTQSWTSTLGQSRIAVRPRSLPPNLMHLATQAAEAGARTAPAGKYSAACDGRGGTAATDDLFMARRSTPDRIVAARRAAAIARLVSAGDLPDRAAAWVARWETTIDGSPSRDDWESLDAWLARERLRGRRPAKP